MDRFRKTYRPLDELETAQVNAIKSLGAALSVIIERGPANREAAIAQTKLEEAVMWAVKGVTA